MISNCDKQTLFANISSELRKIGLIGFAYSELTRYRTFYNYYPQILGTVSQKLDAFKE